MAIEIKNCPVCGMRYDYSEYPQCPYCAKNPYRSALAKRWMKKLNQEEQGIRRNTPEEAAVTAKEEILETSALSDNVIPISTVLTPEMSNQGNEIGEAEALIETARLIQETENLRHASSNAEVPPTESLEVRLQTVGKTTAKYVSVSGGEMVFPVVGWLVCVRGEYYGKSFPLKSGINRVSRSADAEISLPLDASISAQAVVKIVYDSKSRCFNALLGESSSLCYINGNAMYERTPLKGFEEIELGDSEKNKFLFVPLCGDDFNWSEYPNTFEK